MSLPPCFRKKYNPRGIMKKFTLWHKKTLIWGAILFFWCILTLLWGTFWWRKNSVEHDIESIEAYILKAHSILTKLEKHKRLHQKNSLNHVTHEKIIHLFHTWAARHTLHHMHIKIFSEKDFETHTSMTLLVTAESTNDEHVRDFFTTVFREFPGALILLNFSLKKTKDDKAQGKRKNLSPLLLLSFKASCIICGTKKKTPQKPPPKLQSCKVYS